MPSANRMNRIRLFACGGGALLLLAGCLPLAVNNAEPMGIRELDGRVELLLCSSIVIEEVEVISYADGYSGEARNVVSWTGRLDVEAGQVVDLLESFEPRSPNVGEGFAGLGLAQGSRLAVILVSQFDGIGSQVTGFTFDGPMPIGPDWMGSEGSTDRDECEKAP